jgi:GTP-binding protein Era
MFKEGFKSGFVSIIGRPSVGKSTFLSRVMEQKIAIMSDKPQTTRNKIQGVYTTADVQTIFIDTPGIQKPKHKLGDFMMKVATNALREVDAILFMVNLTEPKGKGDDFIIEKLKELDTPIILVMNKVDLIHPNDIPPIIESYRNELEFAAVVPISALQGNNVGPLLEEIAKILPEGPMYYPADQVTDHPERFIISEMIREKVLQKTRDEVPHSIAVAIDQIKTRENGNMVDVHATILIERDSQKGIIIGTRGALLKEICSEARTDIEMLLGTKVYLNLWVKVQKDWRNKAGQLRELGFRDDEY